MLAPHNMTPLPTCPPQGARLPSAAEELRSTAQERAALEVGAAQCRIKTAGHEPAVAAVCSKIRNARVAASTSDPRPCTSLPQAAQAELAAWQESLLLQRQQVEEDMAALAAARTRLDAREAALRSDEVRGKTSGCLQLPAACRTCLCAL